MREYIRHPSEIPIEFDVADPQEHQAEHLHNVSLGGLSFHSPTAVEIGRTISIYIPLVLPKFEAHGRVVWCRKVEDGYEVGVEFIDLDEAFRARMVEQICHIEAYRKKVYKEGGRRLSSEEAAAEWIRKYAGEFPQMEEES